MRRGARIFNSACLLFLQALPCQTPPSTPPTLHNINKTTHTQATAIATLHTRATMQHNTHSMWSLTALPRAIMQSAFDHHLTFDPLAFFSFIFSFLQFLVFSNII